MKPLSGGLLLAALLLGGCTNLSGLQAKYLLHSQRSPNPFDASLLRQFKLPATL